MKKKTKRMSFRLEENLFYIISECSNVLNISMSDILNLSVLSYLENIDLTEEKMGNLDLKEYISCAKGEFMGMFHRKIRNTELSKSFFMQRVKKDILKLIQYKRPIKEIHKIISVYENELLTYPNHKDLEKEFSEFKNFNNSKLLEMKKYLDDNTETVELKTVKDDVINTQNKINRLKNDKK